MHSLPPSNTISVCYRWSSRLCAYLYISTRIMIDEPGSFYICTETSPRCYIIQKVSAKNVEKVCEELHSLQVGDTWPEGADGCGRSNCTSPPPLPVLPWWFTPECERQLENGELVYGEGENELMVAEEPGPGLSPSPECAMMDVQLPEDVAVSPSPGVEECGSEERESPATMGLDELRARLRSQLQYYFSRENLAGDSYLRSQMDNDQYVPIHIIAGFPMVKRLTLDMNLIVEALRDSYNVQVDESGEKVRPAYKRCTLLLREIPASTDVKEVEALFSGPFCPQLTSVEYAHNDSWYVNFETDEDAERAFLHLRTKVQTFRGKPILARIKTGPAPRVTPTNVPGAPSPEAPAPTPNGFRPVPPGNLELVSPVPPTSLVSPSDSATPPPPPSTYLYTSGSGNGAGGLWGQVGFDLGFILAMHGFQPHGTFRPLLHVPPSTMHQLAVSSADAPASHSTQSRRKLTSDQSSSNSSHESGRPRPPRSSLKPPPLSALKSERNYRPHRDRDRENQNYHYDKLLRRPRYQDQRGQRGPPQRRSPHGANDYWSSKQSASSSAVAKDKEKTGGAELRDESFQLQPASFPPLPTSQSSSVEDSKTAGTMESQRKWSATVSAPSSSRSEPLPASSQTPPATPPPQTRSKPVTATFSSVAASDCGSCTKPKSSATLRQPPQSVVKSPSPPLATEKEEEESEGKRPSYAQMVQHSKKESGYMSIRQVAKDTANPTPDGASRKSCVNEWKARALKSAHSSREV